MLLNSLAFLADDVFAHIANAFAFVRFRRIIRAQLGSHLTDNLAHQSAIPSQVSAQLVKGAGNISGGAATSHNGPASPQLKAAITTVETKSISQAARPAVAFAGAVVTLGALISLLVPNIPAEADPVTDPTLSWEQAEGDGGVVDIAPRAPGVGADDTGLRVDGGAAQQR